MESYLNENFGDVKPKHSSEEVLKRWRSLCGVVKNPKRRFRFTANLSKRYEAAAMRRTNHVQTLLSHFTLSVFQFPFFTNLDLVHSLLTLDVYCIKLILLLMF